MRLKKVLLSLVDLILLKCNPQSAFACSKLKIETLEQDVKYV